jgi:hypothetical protein
LSTNPIVKFPLVRPSPTPAASAAQPLGGPGDATLDTPTATAQAGRWHTAGGVPILVGRRCGPRTALGSVLQKSVEFLTPAVNRRDQRRARRNCQNASQQWTHAARKAAKPQQRGDFRWVAVMRSPEDRKTQNISIRVDSVIRQEGVAFDARDPSRSDGRDRSRARRAKPSRFRPGLITWRGLRQNMQLRESGLPQVFRARDSWLAVVRCSAGARCNRFYLAPGALSWLASSKLSKTIKSNLDRAASGLRMRP